MKEEPIQRVQLVFRKVFQDPDLVINPDYTANNIAGWDSLTHMTLIAELENFFSIRFTFQEVSEFKTVGDLIQIITLKVNT